MTPHPPIHPSLGGPPNTWLGSGGRVHDEGVSNHRAANAAPPPCFVSLTLFQPLSTFLGAAPFHPPESPPPESRAPKPPRFLASSNPSWRARCGVRCGDSAGDARAHLRHPPSSLLAQKVRVVPCLSRLEARARVRREPTLPCPPLDSLSPSKQSCLVFVQLHTSPVNDESIPFVSSRSGFT